MEETPRFTLEDTSPGPNEQKPPAKSGVFWIGQRLFTKDDLKDSLTIVLCACRLARAPQPVQDAAQYALQWITTGQAPVFNFNDRS